MDPDFPTRQIDKNAPVAPYDTPEMRENTHP